MQIFTDNTACCHFLQQLLDLILETQNGEFVKHKLVVANCFQSFYSVDTFQRQIIAFFTSVTFPVSRQSFFPCETAVETEFYFGPSGGHTCNVGPAVPNWRRSWPYVHCATQPKIRHVDLHVTEVSESNEAGHTLG